MEDLKTKIREFLNGSGDDSGYGYGSGDGYGYGDGSGDGLKEYNGQAVYFVDAVPTLIDHVHGSFAKGRIVKGDLTTETCYIVKRGGLFAHGETLKEATEAVREKVFDDMPEEDRIAAFVEAYPNPEQAVDNRELFDWHHRLTGSCEMGRKAFVADRGLSLDGKTTVAAFIRLTENAYGGETIRKMKAHYEEDI
jgi:hypothetical protein